MTSDLLHLTAALLKGSCSDPPMGSGPLLREHAKRERVLSERRQLRRANRLRDETEVEAEVQAFGGPLWSVSVPVNTAIIARVIQFAKDGERFVWGDDWVSLTGVTATEKSATATVQGSAKKHSVTSTFDIAYAADTNGVLTAEGIDERTLCMGDWLKCPYGEVRITPARNAAGVRDLRPGVKEKDYGCDVTIRAAARRRIGKFLGIFGDGYIDADIQGFRITPTYGELVTSSRAKSFVLPKFNWQVKTGIEVEVHP